MAVPRATTIIPAHDMEGRKIADQVALDYDRRYRRRLLLETQSGRSVLLDLAEARHLKDAEGLLVEDGSVIRVVASPEPVIDIAAAALADLVRIAWHLGNRHLPTQLLGASLRIREDHVIADMVQRLGGTVTRKNAAFDPEGGAYGETLAAHGHAHDRE